MFSSIFCFLLELGLHDRYSLMGHHTVFYTFQNTLFQSQPYFLSGDYRYSLMDHHTGIIYLPEHFISISALFSLRRLQVFIDGPLYRYSIPSRTLFQSQSHFLSGDYRYSLMGHHTGILYLPEHFISISAYFLSGDYRYSLMGHHTGILYLPEHYFNLSLIFSREITGIH